jgi:hypothetical protein
LHCSRTQVLMHRTSLALAWILLAQARFLSTKITARLECQNDSKISWTHHTVNFWMGCTKVSAGCRECYAEGECARFDHAEWGDDADRTPVKSAHPNARKFDRAAREKECRDVVFCASLSDLFEDRADVEELRDAAWKTIRETPNLVWILLTKRPENIAPMLPDDWGEEGYPIRRPGQTRGVRLYHLGDIDQLILSSVEQRPTQTTGDAHPDNTPGT